MSILIKNGTVVNDDHMFKADVLVRDGIIVQVGSNIDCPDAELVDATDRLIIPGGIDPHTHMQLPFMGEVAVDDFYHGTRAAVAGGTTMIIDFVVPARGVSLLDAYKTWRGWADEEVCIDYALTVAVTSWNESIAEEMTTLTAPEYGINSFKFYLAYKDQVMVSDEEFYRGMEHSSKIGAFARVHAENGAIIAAKAEKLQEQGITGPEGHSLSRPEELEAEATNRACVLASQANCPLYVVHVMSKGAARAIAYHRSKGNVIFGEAVGAALGTTGSHYFDKDWAHAAGYVMSPPLSVDPSTPAALMSFLSSDNLQLVGSDNCTWSCCQKEKGRNDFTKIPSGVNGVEDRMSIVWERGVHSGHMNPMRFVAITSTTCAKIFGIYPRKGRIAVGSDADIVIWNPNAERTISKETHHQAVDFNIFEGERVHGVAEVTIARGKIVWNHGQLVVKKGAGKFIALSPFVPFVFGAVEQRKLVKGEFPATNTTICTTRK